jgi:hypothetical protein
MATLVLIGSDFFKPSSINMVRRANGRKEGGANDLTPHKRRDLRNSKILKRG